MVQPGEISPIVTHGFLLDGQWLTAGDASELRSPANHAVISRVAQATRSHVEAAISAAQRAFEVTRKLPSCERQRVLREVAGAIAAHREEFARTMAIEAAKPLKAARVEVDRAVFTFNLAAEESTRIGGEWLPMDLLPSTVGRWSLVRRFPVGPIAAITPFNFPLNLAAHKLAPAMAAGCTVVHKPAPQTPLCALKLGEIIQNAGWPGGALNVLPAAVADAEPMITDARIKLLSFTGSATVGWELKQKAGKKRVVLELGEMPE